MLKWIHFNDPDFRSPRHQVPIGSALPTASSLTDKSLPRAVAPQPGLLHSEAAQKSLAT